MLSNSCILILVSLLFRYLNLTYWTQNKKNANSYIRIRVHFDNTIKNKTHEKMCLEVLFLIALILKLDGFI